MSIPKRVDDRIKAGTRKFRKILESARAADRSEQDTVTIVTDMLAELFGYDKYQEITGEYSIRGTYCDLAVKLSGKVKYLIEVKAIDKSLKDNHLRQATDYAAKEGIEWVVLTNAVEWQTYRMVFEQPVRYEHVFTADFLKDARELSDLVFMLSKEGIVKQAISEYHEQRQALDRDFLAAILLSDVSLNLVRREIRRVCPGIKVDTEMIRNEVVSNVIKREIIEGKAIKEAERRLRRAAVRKLRASSSKKQEKVSQQGSINSSTSSEGESGTAREYLQ